MKPFKNITVESVFNYNASQLSSKLVAIVADNAEVEAVSEGTASLIFAETPFYAEMGGQVADHGQILDEAGSVVATVTNVQKAPNGQALHTVEVLAPLALNQEYTLAIDSNRRHRVMKTTLQLTCFTLPFTISLETTRHKQDLLTKSNSFALTLLISKQ